VIFADEISKVDPREDGWDTEAFSDLAMGQLKELGQWLVHPDASAEKDLEAVADVRFSASALRAEPLDEVFNDGVIQVFRTAAASEEQARPNTEALQELPNDSPGDWRPAVGGHQ